MLLTQDFSQLKKNIFFKSSKMSLRYLKVFQPFFQLHINLKNMKKSIFEHYIIF